MRHHSLQHALASVTDIGTLGQGITADFGVGADIVRKQRPLLGRSDLGLDDEILLRGVDLIEFIILIQLRENLELPVYIVIIREAQAVILFLNQRIVVRYDIGLAACARL